jgi:hypothetical protein
VDVSGSDTAYADLLCSIWDEPEDTLLVEHDVELHAKVVRQLRTCFALACRFSYQGPPAADGTTSWVPHGLGCIRFSAELKASVPWLMRQVKGKHWKTLDSALEGPLAQASGGLHLHEPPVTHHHRYYPRPACSCGALRCPP